MAIKSRELKPTKENLLATLSKDLLDRNIDIWRFARFCDAQEGSCSIALDAKWGAGKTFFVKQVQMLIESFNQYTEIYSEEEVKEIQRAFYKYIHQGTELIKLQPAVCVYYDAWSNDNDEDPVLSLIYEIINGAAQHYSFKTDIDYLKGVSLIVDFFTGKNTTDILNLLRNADPLSSLKSKKEIHTLVSEFLDSLLPEKGNRLIVFIDELDRCKPNYAVRLLERIKHYFSNDRITFVFSVNLQELQHTIKGCYGEDFDGCRYLDRFFDYRFDLPKANMVKYYRELGIEDSYWVFDSTCKAVIDYCGFGLREVEKFYRISKIAAYKPTHDREQFIFADEKAMGFAFCVIVPLVLGLKIANYSLYNEFVSGNNPEPLVHILGNGDFAHGYCSGLLDSDETFDGNAKEPKKSIQLSDKLTQVYKTIFAGVGTDNLGRAHIGEYVFSKTLKDEILKATSMLSEYADYE